MGHAYYEDEWDDEPGCRQCRDLLKAKHEAWRPGDQEQLDLFGLTHRSTWPTRVDSSTHHAEGIFWRRWVKINRKDRILAHVLKGESVAYNMVPTDRDSIVAASVVQWLGTNVGRGFIDGCEREARWTSSMLSYNYSPAEKEDQERARAMAAPVRGQPGYEATVGRIAEELARARRKLTRAKSQVAFPDGERVVTDKPTQRGILIAFRDTD